MTDDPKRKGGRPRQFEGRVQVATRLTKEIHGALKKSAARSGRSLSEEIEYQLQQSLDAWGLVDKLAHRLIEMMPEEVQWAALVRSMFTPEELAAHDRSE